MQARRLNYSHLAYTGTACLSDLKIASAINQRQIKTTENSIHSESKKHGQNTQHHRNQPKHGRKAHHFQHGESHALGCGMAAHITQPALEL